MFHGHIAKHEFNIRDTCTWLMIASLVAKTKSRRLLLDQSSRRLTRGMYCRKVKSYVERRNFRKTGRALK